MTPAPISVERLRELLAERDKFRARAKEAVGTYAAAIDAARRARGEKHGD